ncbi:MAG: aldehyde ferredoxin oxidoreductase, partial [Abditibacteriales bacterium]|nr:aldehyde ferredoxin oxidoreductase [Abditibacteriales bacterium]
MVGGWTGKILRVNLTAGTCHTEEVPEAWRRDYIGGRGLAAKYLYEEMDPTVDAFSPENKLIFATGPLTGTSTSTNSRYMVVTKGALTGAITTSNSGGHWAAELKYAGYDMVIIEGKAAKPVYLFIYDDMVEIRSAEHLWGKTVSETEDLIREEVGVPDLHVAGIGPAGENLVRFACIINDKHRAAGRSGVGAVMGSKHLKAIAVRGTQAVSVARPQEFLQADWAMKKAMLENEGRKGLTAGGTIPTMDLTQAFAGLPTRNFASGQFEHADDINGVALEASRLVRNKACYGCT